MILTYPIQDFSGLWFFSLKVWDYQSQGYIVKRYFSSNSYAGAIALYHKVMASRLNIRG